MKRRAAVYFFLLICAASLSAQELPQAVSAYYQDWNFVVNNSTSHRRQVLWSAFRRHETVVLSGAEQEVLVRMSRVAEATEPHRSSMPMLLAETAAPVTSELLAPDARRFVGRARIVVRVRVLQPASRGAQPEGRPLARWLGSRPAMISMCQYADEWTMRGGTWRVQRSPAMWVSLNTPN